MAQSSGKSRRRVRIGAEIRAYRIHRGLTQKNLARELGVSQQTIGDWELGRAERMLKAMDQLFLKLHQYRATQRVL